MPRFRTDADDQSSKSDHFGNIRLRLRGAFTPARPATDWRVFAGRTEILATLIRAIEETQLHVVLYGERGIGKTSIVNIVAQAARDAHYRVIYMPCDAKSDFNEVFRSIAGKIPLLFHGGVDPTAPEIEAGKSLVDVLPTGPLTARAVSDVFASVVGTRVLVILDEFDRSESENFRHSVAELLKMLSDRAMRVQLVIAGVAMDLIELIEHVPSVQRNIFALHLPPMAGDEIRQIVSNGERVVGLHFEPGATDAVVAIVDGFPYFANLVCHYAALRAIDKERTTITREDVLDGHKDALQELRGRVSHRSQSEITACTEAGCLPALHQLAHVALHADGVINAENIRRLVPSPQMAAHCQNALQVLVSGKLLIETVESDAAPSYRFVDGNVAPYLLLKASEGRGGRSEMDVSGGVLAPVGDGRL